MWSLAALFLLVILFQQLIRLKNNQAVIGMKNKEVKHSYTAEVSGHFASLAGSALVTAAMTP
ncbi:hypothetical protein [Priestia megaterium]|uniref:hypothetical protein n=1 Tax=Priestia megaterium TaxID=1404 RepID=UPI000BFB2232|nr:hypothetical protein [Priestia megaterium]PGT75531.1 hypothetical protein COD15_07250 [Priestia megaterium]